MARFDKSGDEPITTRKEVYGSSLEAMRHCNVKVYFVDTATYEAIQKADDHGLKLLGSLSPSTS